MSRWLVLVPFFVACGGAGRADTILSLTGDETAGATIYDDNCAVCHGADGTGVTRLTTNTAIDSSPAW